MSSQKISLGQTESLKRRSNFFALAIILLIVITAHGLNGSHKHQGLAPSLSRRQTGATANKQEPVKLALDQLVEKEIANGECHDYAIQVSANQFAALTIQQRGVDVLE